MKSFAHSSIWTIATRRAGRAINLHSLTGRERGFERMLTQMELMHSVVDLDRPISIHGEQIAETLITRSVPSSLRLPAAIVLSRDSHRQHTYPPGHCDVASCCYRARAMYLRDRNSTTPDPTTRADEVEELTMRDCALFNNM